MRPASDSAPASSDSSSLNESTTALAETAASTVSLLQNFSTSLKSLENTSKPVLEDPPNPLDVLHTSATLLKAHTTKLSLLIINKPFTPSAIRKVIRDAANTCIPAMMSAVEICRPCRYGQILHEEVKALVDRAYRAFEHVLQELLSNLASLSNSKQVKDASEKDSLTSTGVLWGACDQLIALKNLRLAGLVVRKALLYQSMLEDAMNELQEWAEDQDDHDDNEEEVFKYESVNDTDDGDSFEEVFGPSSKIPSDRPDLRDALEELLRKLKQMKSLYNSLMKYRLRDLNPMNVQDNPGETPSRSVAHKVDQVMDHLRRIPELVDELAGSLYELDGDKARQLMKSVFKRGREAAELMKLNWSGEEDEFTAWAGVWLRLVDQE